MGESRREGPSHHLLRVMAAVPVTNRLLDLGCGPGRHADALTRLGFDVWACDADDALVREARDVVGRSVGHEEAERRVSVARPQALGYPDNHFDWLIAFGSFDVARDADDLFEMLAESRRVMKPGAWIYAAMRPDSIYPDLEPETFAKLFSEADFAIAEMPDWEGDFVRGIFRKVGSGVSA